MLGKIRGRRCNATQEGEAAGGKSGLLMGKNLGSVDISVNRARPGRIVDRNDAAAIEQCVFQDGKCALVLVLAVTTNCIVTNILRCITYSSVLLTLDFVYGIVRSQSLKVIHYDGQIDTI